MEGSSSIASTAILPGSQFAAEFPARSSSWQSIGASSPPEDQPQVLTTVPAAASASVATVAAGSPEATHQIACFRTRAVHLWATHQPCSPCRRPCKLHSCSPWHLLPQQHGNRHLPLHPATLCCTHLACNHSSSSTSSSHLPTIPHCTLHLVTRIRSWVRMFWMILTPKMMQPRLHRCSRRMVMGRKAGTSCPWTVGMRRRVSHHDVCASV
mmetsp:Transcript_17207/g.43162  ORF Transcript_17207/g.43162 Transcript_17207/m.43162 type:complete len:211 (+) Transcript_17207:247-879(+)